MRNIIQKILLLMGFTSLSLIAEGSIMKSIGDDLSSPITTEAWHPFSIGLLTTAGLLVFEDSIVDPTQSETVEDKPLGSSSKTGDILGQGVPNLVYAIGAYSGYLFTEDTLYARRGNHMVLATAYSGVMAQLLKKIAREPRPNDFHDRVSFPSGHTTTAFAFASSIQIDHGWAWGVPAYLMATFVGYSRINDNKHYLHDVAAGATLGIGYGLGIHYSMSNRLQSPGGFSGVQLIPQPSGITMLATY